MTYNTNFAPNETRNGYFILAATNLTAPNVGTIKGYAVFYEGNSTAGSNVLQHQNNKNKYAHLSFITNTAIPPTVSADI